MGKDAEYLPYNAIKISAELSMTDDPVFTSICSESGEFHSKSSKKAELKPFRNLHCVRLVAWLLRFELHGVCHSGLRFVF